MSSFDFRKQKMLKSRQNNKMFQSFAVNKSSNDPSRLTESKILEAFNALDAEDYDIE